MNVNNANNPTYVPAYVPTTQFGAGGANTNGLTQQEIAERQVVREVFSRVNSQGLGMAHLTEVRRLTGGQVSVMQASNTITTQYSEAIRSQTIDIVRELMGNEEQGSLRMNALQQLLDGVMNGIHNDPSRTRQWMA